ncbi:MAG TPA: hypothetical protein VN026_12770 [Bacteroidia bacterium]|jgi:hypothetical protein|nr:hypothetical protein [Bacteroidia bacterium]
MNSTNAIIGKNLVLIALVVLTVFTVFQGVLNSTDLLIIQAMMGIVYALLSYFEYNNTSYKALLPVERFAYYPGSFYMYRFIKIGIYLTFALVLAFSPSRVDVLYPICLALALTEIIISLLKYYKKLCFVNVYANYILIALEEMEKIFVTEVDHVEYRHDIFYIIKKNGRSTMIKTFSIQDKDVFINKMKDWIVNNDIKISPESAEKLKAIN